MNDLSALMNSVFRSALFFVAACLMVWAFIPDAKPYAAGLVLGTFVSLVNSYLLAHKIKVLTRHVIEKTGERVGIGYLGRLSMALIAVMVSLKFPQFNLISVVLGLFYSQIVIFMMGLSNAFKSK